MDYVPSVILDKKTTVNENIKEGFSMIKQTNILFFKNETFWMIIIVGIFFKAFNSILMTYLEYNTMPTLVEYFGLFIMCIGLSLFVYRNYSK